MLFSLVANNFTKPNLMKPSVGWTALDDYCLCDFCFGICFLCLFFLFYSFGM